MKLLICTQKVDSADPVLGFFHRWILEFSRVCEQVTVICLQEGASEMPSNVRIFSLGKEDGRQANGIISGCRYAWRFKKLAWKLRNDYDAVLAHMNPEYIALAGISWRILGKKIGLWYVHRQVNWKLRIAAFFSHYIFTVSSGSINLRGGKLRFLGHGIDTNQFRPNETREREGIIRIVSVGRITPIKNLDTLVEACALLKRKIGAQFTVKLVGEPATFADREYDRELKKKIVDLGLGDIVKCLGARTHEQMPEIYRASDLEINLAPKGGLDKAVLEAMAAGVPVVVSNQSFAETLGIYADELMFRCRDSNDLAERMSAIFESLEDNNRESYLRQRIVDKHNLSTLVGKMVNIFAYGKN